MATNWGAILGTVGSAVGTYYGGSSGGAAGATLGAGVGGSIRPARKRGGKAKAATVDQVFPRERDPDQDPVALTPGISTAGGAVWLGGLMTNPMLFWIVGSVLLILGFIWFVRR
jgi:hypothetical protein